uniref:Uncharacterized protein n=1 Tax=Rhizophora mucronata TaxID=61149 RepID=A0A2P2QZ50_RHIMU
MLNFSGQKSKTILRPTIW